MDFDQEKKVLPDQWHIGANSTGACIGFTAGSEKTAFVIPFANAKALMLRLKITIEKIEKDNNMVFDADAVETHQRSPIQPGR